MMTPIFWGAQAVPFLGLMGLFGWKTRRRRLQNREGQRRAAWESETAELQRKLRQARGSRQTNISPKLCALVQLKTALVASPNDGVEPNTVDAETAVAAFDLPEEKQVRMRELFRRSDELRYSGRAKWQRHRRRTNTARSLELIESLS